MGQPVCRYIKDGLSGGRALRGLEGGLGDAVRVILERWGCTR
jgi:hypothetical protein